MVYNTTYTAADQIAAREMSGGLLALVHPQIKNRQFSPIQNYKIQYYANDKIVALWQKNHNPLLYLKGEFSSKKEGVRAKPFEAGDPIFLYLSKNSEELKVW